MKKINYNKSSRIIRNIDWKLIAIVVIIFLFGLIVLSSATHTNVTGNYKKLVVQIIAFLIGIVIISLIMLFDYNSIGKYYKELYVIGIVLLLLVYVPGLGSTQFGARSWIKLGADTNLQTSELAKLTFILSYAKIVDNYKDNIRDIKVLGRLILFAIPYLGLILGQPDLGTAIVFMSIIFFILYVAGINKKIIRNVFIGGIILSPIMYFFMASHQRLRIINFFNPDAPSNYHVLQSMIAIGSGGLFGKGLYHGSQNQENFLPVRDSDFIFAVIGEEFGFFGMIFVILMFVLMISRLITISKRSKNSYGSLIVAGIIGMFTYQIIQNIGMTVGLLPVTGLTLPFVSYGGSSMLTSMANIGIVLNVYLRRKKINLY